jgi:hypothetical protein
MNSKERAAGGFVWVGEIPLLKQLQKELKPPSAINHRLQEIAVTEREKQPDDPRSILYQHTVLCQTYLPRRKPKDSVTTVNQG